MCNINLDEYVYSASELPNCLATAFRMSTLTLVVKQTLFTMCTLSRYSPTFSFATKDFLFLAFFAYLLDENLT
jgi:hypothetical protein